MTFDWFLVSERINLLLETNYLSPFSTLEWKLANEIDGQAVVVVVFVITTGFSSTWISPFSGSLSDPLSSCVPTLSKVGLFFS